MYVNNSIFSKTVAFLCCVFTAIALFGVFPKVATAATPSWMQNPQLLVRWVPFTALPAPPDNSVRYIFENDYVVSVGYYNLDDPKIWRLTSTNPVTYTEAVTNIGQYRLTSAAFTSFNNDPPALYLGSGVGLLKLNPVSKSFEDVWPWGWDPLFISGGGDRIDGIVTRWGNSQSGRHRWITNTHILEQQFGSEELSQIWTDPVSKNFGMYVYYPKYVSVRMTGTNSSVIFLGNMYSTNGGISCSKIGRYSALPGEDVSPILDIDQDNAYMYAPGIAIVNNDSFSTNNSNIYIGRLGGLFRSLNCPVGYPTILNYNQQTRLLIAGNSSGLYSTILPSETQTLPVLGIQPAIIVSWSSEYSSAMLLGSTNVSGPWQEVQIPQTTSSNEVHVAIPTDSNVKFFQLSLP